MLICIMKKVKEKKCFSAVAFDSGETFDGKKFSLRHIQVIDGKAELIIDDKSHLLETGQSIIIPAHFRNTIKANVRFKMLSTIIKSGYEEIISWSMNIQ